MSGIDFMFVERRRVHVYRLPDRLTHGYCFGGGHPIAFQNVDWFDVPAGEDRGHLVSFIKEKPYYRPDARFLVLGDVPELTFVVEREARV
ncbi:hypothetical protein [Methylobacterium nonmethylotrophicum]|uniref:Uncharacterized protein n=1 Tax=Methylobacterium nonmethylotrophicum TaxID=1141884 RepID=A0A4Z0NPZ1_9HYPH|nr:hypothetical protein [Methylobacterium nonmethylotrophicum]TGD98069.1 hypothetical protein EU555_18150 [Methylobacterium nonmethylotrophicum]